MRRSSFLKKRSKKLLPCESGAAATRAPSDKSFLVLFFKKELLFLLLSAAAADPVVAVRGTDQITASQVRALITAADPQTRAKLASDPKALQDAVRNALIQRGVLEAARAANWERRPEVTAMLARTRDAAIAQSFLASHAAPPAAYPSEAEIQAAYEQAKPQLMQPRAYQLTQLSIPLAPTASPQQIDAARNTLNAARNAFASGHAPAGTQQLDLGWVPENRLQPGARDGVSGLLEGQVSAPVCSKTGCALLKLVATRQAGPAPLAEVRDGLIRLLRQQKERQGEQDFANTLLARAPVRIDEIALAQLAGAPATR
jgi:peptidylprolyl isomerase